MTDNVTLENMQPFENPDCLPLERLKLKICNGGIVQYVDALNEIWASDRYFLHYEVPNLYNDDGSTITGAKKRWITVVNYMIDDLRWLLSLPFYRFWSNIVYNTTILDALVSFLQEAPPFYALEHFSNCSKMQELLQELGRYVLIVFTRLLTYEEGPQQYMSPSYFKNLIYEKYIFTIPIIFDLCQFYGRQNGKLIEKMLNDLFILEPRYNDDLQKIVPCLIEALENVEVKFICNPIVSNKAVPLSQRNAGTKKLTLFNLEDMILYVLDIVSTITVFLKNYHPAVPVFRTKGFMNKIISIYENTIPEIYRSLDKLAYNDQNMQKHIELKRCLDVTRIEIIQLFRIITYELILCVQENVNTIEEAEIKNTVDEYLNLLSNAISAKEFITDYVQRYPIKIDLNMLRKFVTDLDTVKCDYMLNAISATIGEPTPSSNNSFTNTNDAIPGPSGISNQRPISENISSVNEERAPLKNSVELACYISEVKDILCELDENFIKMCLEHYNYSTEAVINAVLEESLPPHLKQLKDNNSMQVPSPPPSYDEAINVEDLTHDFKTVSIPDTYDDVHVKIPEVIEVPKDYIKQNYSLVLDEYEDEYDDTYDDHHVRNVTQDDEAEAYSKPFTTPRVLEERKNTKFVDDSESEDENVEAKQNGKDQFIQNPEEIRARAEQRRQAMRNNRGNQKNECQENDVLHNRPKKCIHRATYVNHNRRFQAEAARKRGTMPF